MGLAVMMVLDVSQPAAQSFSSGSDESDGALTLANSLGVVFFDPVDTARWGRVLDPDGDGVYHFTTITIGAGTSLRLRADKLNKPVHWLATGNVVISGTVNLDGENASATNDLSLRRLAAIPGSGGYAGGLGGRTNPPTAPATPGEGPGGGSGGHTTAPFCSPSTICGRGGTFTGNRYLIPLIGGSGGEGAVWDNNFFYNGGAGGGAILIASSTSIAVVGTIAADGGFNVSSLVAGGGSGGAIRLVAPILSGSGVLSVNGTNTLSPSGAGWVRLEGFQVSTTFFFPAGTIYVTRGAPIDEGLLRPPAGSVRVTAIAGVPIPIYPTGSFELPDATINSNNPVNVDIQATGIPPGTVVTLRVFPQIPDDPTAAELPSVQATLQGTLELSTATVSVTFPYGFSRGYVRATWTQ